jgi:hypothetical protein
MGCWFGDGLDGGNGFGLSGCGRLGCGFEGFELGAGVGELAFEVGEPGRIVGVGAVWSGIGRRRGRGVAVEVGVEEGFDLAADLGRQWVKWVK